MTDKLTQFNTAVFAVEVNVEQRDVEIIRSNRPYGVINVGCRTNNVVAELIEVVFDLQHPRFFIFYYQN